MLLDWIVYQTKRFCLYYEKVKLKLFNRVDEQAVDYVHKKFDELTMCIYPAHIVLQKLFAFVLAVPETRFDLSSFNLNFYLIVASLYS